MKVLIDNGHGDSTPGKRSPDSRFFEYSWNREIAERVVSELCLMGVDADLLVEEISDISLKERVRRVNAECRKFGSSNVLLISVHANACGNGSSWMNGRGWSAYTSKGNTKSDKVAEYLYDQAEKIFIGMKIRKDYSDGDRDWEEDFYILKNTMCPAVLTENFFYDNKEDLAYILSDEGKNAVVKVLVRGVVAYLNSL